MVLSAEDDLEGVALAGDGASALQAVLAYQPDVLVADTQMPGPGVAELVRLVGEARPATRVLLLAEDPRRPAAALMSRAVSARELAAAIRAVAAGRQMPPAGGAPVAAPFTTPAHHLDLRLRSLSERERQILVLVTRGYSNRRIAEVSYLSLNTVRTHVQSVLVKLGVHSKLEAAALAVRQGLVPAGDGGDGP
jgi:DNA-binding NarL/FixJ family response regulator